MSDGSERFRDTHYSLSGLILFEPYHTPQPETVLLNFLAVKATEHTNLSTLPPVRSLAFP